jgi:hypothetical protein
VAWTYCGAAADHRKNAPVHARSIGGTRSGRRWCIALVPGTITEMFETMPRLLMMSQTSRAVIATSSDGSSMRAPSSAEIGPDWARSRRRNSASGPEHETHPRAKGACTVLRLSQNHSESARAARVLTVRQPYASLIIYGGKDVENRSQPTRFRGRLYIHAGAALHDDAPKLELEPDMPLIRRAIIGRARR